MTEDRIPMLTTTDNPYNPVTQFDEWYAFDVQKGYNTCGLLDIVTQTSPELPDNLSKKFVLDGMKEIVRINVSGKHKIVYKDELISS